MSVPDPPSSRTSRDQLRRSMLKLDGNPSPKVSAPAPCCQSPEAVPEACCCGGGNKSRADWLLWISLVAMTSGLAAHWWLPHGPAWLHVFGHTCLELLSKSWWGILAGIFAVAVIGRVPRELVAALLGRHGSINGLFRAVAAGLLLDLCNHGILMVGMGLYKRGASLGQTFAFLVASPWNSLSLTLILAGLIGWKWMLSVVLLSALVALITGWLADRLVAAGKLPANPNSVNLPDDFRYRPMIAQTLRSLKPTGRNAIDLLREGLAGSEMILRWILLGFVLTGLLRAFVSMDAMQHWFGPSLLGLALTLVATTVMEVCSEGSSPIAADLLIRAHAPGNMFLFLMAGATTDYTEIMSLRSTTGRWFCALALPLLTVPQVLLIGWLLNRYGGG